MPDLTNEERAAVFDSVNATIAKFHLIDYKALGLEDFGREGQLLHAANFALDKAIQALRNSAY